LIFQILLPPAVVLVGLLQVVAQVAELVLVLVPEVTEELMPAVAVAVEHDLQI
jgi:hypothetical protein